MKKTMNIMNNEKMKMQLLQVTGFYDDPEDANAYYFCHQHGVGLKVNCTPADYQWNQETEACVPPRYNEVCQINIDQRIMISKQTHYLLKIWANF